MLNKECQQNQGLEKNKMLETSEVEVDTSKIVSTVSYEASTRGFYERVWITKDSLIITNDRNHVKTVSHKTSEKDWDELLAILKDVAIDSISELEAPTSMRHYDGARFATLIIAQGKSEVQSSGFDHGHPPKAIEAVVNKVLSIKASHEKN